MYVTIFFFKHYSHYQSVEGICGQSNADLQAVPASLSPHPWPHLSCGSSLLFFTVCLRSLITKLMCNDTHFLQHTVTVCVSSRRKPYSVWHFFPLPACSHSDSLRKPSICYRLWLMALLIAVFFFCFVFFGHEDTYTPRFEHIYFLRWLEKAVNHDTRRHSVLTYLCAV